jgi:hypothetical protein
MEEVRMNAITHLAGQMMTSLGAGLGLLLAVAGAWALMQELLPPVMP